MVVEVSFARWDHEDLGRKWTTSSTQEFFGGDLEDLGDGNPACVSTALSVLYSEDILPGDKSSYSDTLY